MTNRLWFRAKTYGYGWTPNTWQGWSITALFILAVIGLFGNIDSTSHSVSDTLINFALPFVSLLIFYIIIWGTIYKVTLNYDIDMIFK